MITKQKTVAKRLWFLVGMFVVNLIVYGWVEHWNEQQLSRQIHVISDTELPAIRNMTLVDMMHDGIRAVVYQGLYEAANGNATALEEVRQEFAEFSKNITDYSNKIDALDIREETKAAISASRTAVEAYVAAGQQIIDATSARNLTLAKTKLPAFAEQFEVLEERLGKLGDTIETESTEALKHSAEVESRSNIITFAVMLLGILVALFNGFMTIRSLTTELNHVTNELSDESKQMQASSDQINRAAQSLSESSTQQSSAIEETVTSMEEITSMIGQTAQNTGSTQEQTNSALEEARSGKQVVDRMVASMSEISNANDKLNTIVKVIDEIKTKTKIINDIAFETRLLSFNASIEAARAGAHGRGFAVVAEEVGKLASVSSKAADDVRDLLESSLNQVSNIVDETKGKVHEGQSRSKECEVAFNNMEQFLDKISQSVQLISTATREQQGGVKQTNQAMAEMERVTQVNARSAENLTTEAKRVTNNSKQVNQSIERLQMLVGSSRTTASKIQNLSSTPKSKTRSGSNEQHGKGNQTSHDATHSHSSQDSSAGSGVGGTVSQISNGSTSSDDQSVSRNDKRWFAA
jgi:methyl-accepting chemotaxis protein